MSITLVKSGEIHTNGWEVYRPKGSKPSRNSKGLSGTVYVWDGEHMYICGKAYKDMYGCFDGEPLWRVSGYTLMEDD